MATIIGTTAPHHLTTTSPAALVFEPFDLPSTNQRQLGAPHSPGTVTPLALRPSTHHADDLSLNTVISTIQSLQSHDSLLTQKLAVHGCLLFRDLPIHSAKDFSAFAHAFGYSPHEIIGIVVSRPLLAPNVAPANEAPKGVQIYHHNESPQVPHAPEYVFFYCHRAPRKGGETPISSSLELFHRLEQEIPEFIAQLGEKGILSRVTYKFQAQYSGGSTLRQAFGKEIQDGDDEATQRAKVEAQIKRYNRGEYTTWKWIPEGIEVTHRLPAIRRQQATLLPSLFTGLGSYWKRRTAKHANVTQQLFGDETPIPDEWVEVLVRVTEEIRVLHKWERGDVLVYDNVVAQHGREPWEGEQEDRIVMASLFDGAPPGKYGESEWAQVVKALETELV